MRIKTPEQVGSIRSIVGDLNAAKAVYELARGSLVWFFQSEEKMVSDPDLRPDERVLCLKMFREQKLGWAGLYRDAPSMSPTGFQFSPHEYEPESYVSRDGGKWSH